MIDTTALKVSRFQSDDLDAVVAIDTQVTGREKRAFWREHFGRHLANPNMICFVARTDTDVCGFLVGEIRAYEFGQDPCGWVLALGVQPEQARSGCGKQLLGQFLSWLTENNIDRVRTMVTHDQMILHRFFRSTGFVAGPYLQLEREI